MGILNVTPDSFSDGGLFDTAEKAIARGLEMIEEGVDIIDIGGESTRPGAERVSQEEEISRVIPVITALAARGARISIDTMRAATADAAVKAGASIINDVSGGLADDEMFSVVAKRNVPYILMHWRGHSKEMNSRAVYRDVVSEVIDELAERVVAAKSAGIKSDQIILDPGLGFAKDAEHNWEILRNLDRFTALGHQVLIGGSRKRFLGGEKPEDREEASIELTRSLNGKGIWAVRVHTVKPHKDVIT